MEKAEKRDPFLKRIHEIDFIRGFLMLMVLMDHLFNLTLSFNEGWAGGLEVINAGGGIQPFLTFYNIALFYWTNPARGIIRWIVLMGFCFISGVSCAFSRNNWKRAFQMVALWLAIYIVTFILNSYKETYSWNVGLRSMRVDFNIIGVLAFSTLTYCFIQDKSWKWLVVFIVIALAIHPLCVIVSDTDFGRSIYAPAFWHPSEQYSYQADYMPLFPYLAFFLGGALLTKFTYAKERKSYIKRFNWERPICFVGRHSLIIYGAHFLVFIGIFKLAELIIGQ